MNKKIMMSALSIVSALTIMGGATYAAFTSEAQNEGNTFGSGDLVLQINGAGGNGSTPFYTVPTAAPGDSFEQTFVLSNSGDVDASVVRLDQIDLGGNTELGDVLTLELFKDDGDNSGELGTDDVSLGSAHLSAAGWNDFALAGVTLPAGGSQRIYARLTFDSTADNSYQNKNLNFNIDFRADQ